MLASLPSVSYLLSQHGITDKYAEVNTFQRLLANL